MHHGLSNIYMYAVSRIIVRISNGISESILSGTGFFVKKDNGVFLITNRHIIQPEWSDVKYQGYKLVSVSFDCRSYNDSTKTVETENIPIKSFEVKYADNNKDDIACITNIATNNNPQKVPICMEYSMLANSEHFEKDFCICDQVAVIGFPVVYDHKNNMPVLRSGVISTDPRLDYSFDGNDNGHILGYEAFSTNGNSGSPVFAIQKGFKLGAGLRAPDGFYRPVMLIGINAGSILSQPEGIHQQMSYMFKSDQIIKLIEDTSNAIYIECK